ncbi:DUF188 domain-containing protein [Halorussus halophilus]|uniref:DUF188 domain-containing protein n=1 Tax=Halorussus halophilus TaxID=2650975 RepID=UPI0013018B26|nr:DUF188 domain-containing protein [Halorussus halophilus]
MTAVVALDTSALMMPVECDVRLFDELERLLGEYDCVVPQAIHDELAKLSQGASEEAVAASVGADLATDRCRTIDAESEASYADDVLVELADEFDYVVTNDGPLRQRLLDAGASVIHIRGRNKLEISQP